MADVTIAELKTFVVRCDWRDTEGHRCPAVGKKIKAFFDYEVADELRRRGWAVAQIPGKYALGHYCNWHSSEGKPYPPMDPSRRVPASMREKEDR